MSGIEPAAHLLIGGELDRPSRVRILCGGTLAERMRGDAAVMHPRDVSCGLCLRRIARWEGPGGRLPSWTAYQVDPTTVPGRLCVQTAAGDVLADVGDFLLHLPDGTLSVLPFVSEYGRRA